MKIFKMYNLNWQKGQTRVVRKQTRWGDDSLKVVYVENVYDKSVELKFISVQEPNRHLLKSDFGFFGDWEMIEQLTPSI